LIWVERKSQKNIVIGKQGRVLKEVGTEARRDIEEMLDGKVNLKLWVKIKEGWADDERALHSLGYTHDD
jgi:GTP-binding protein Era